MRRDLAVARVAKEFGVLPSVVARDLDNDPEQLSLNVIPLLRYEEAFRAFERGDKAELKRWAGSPVMKAVEENAFDMVRREMESEG